MRITFILPSHSRKPVGGYKVVYEYANRLVEKGHEVSVVHPRKLRQHREIYPNSIFGQRIIERLVQIARIFIKTKPKWRYVDPRVQLLYVSEPTADSIPDADIVIATLWAVAEYIMEYPKIKGEKVYLIQHYETWCGPKEKVDAIWRSSLHKIVISKWLLDIGNSLDSRDLFYLPLGIDQNHFRITNPIEGRVPCVSMMYSEWPWKGAKEGIEALILAKNDFPELNAIFFGVGKRGANVPEWIKYYQDPKQDFLVEGIYNQSSIIMCPSHLEGFAAPPAEGMACGCAAVTADCGGVKDFAENEVTALICPPKDSMSLADCLTRFLKDDHFRINMAKAGNERIKQLTWEKSTDLLEGYLRKITAGPSV